MKQKFEQSEGWIKVSVDLKVYPLQSIHSAGYAFMDKAHIKLEEEKKDLVAVWLKPKDGAKDLEKVALDFCEELLNYAHYFSSLKANADNMKTLIQRALFSASPSIVKEAEEKEIENLIKELEAEETQAPAKSKKTSKSEKA
jgi:His-Xaa-Ser system protein HxsD